MPSKPSITTGPPGRAPTSSPPCAGGAPCGRGGPGGRGAGKTRAGAEWVRGRSPGSECVPARRIGLVGETLSEARGAMGKPSQGCSASTAHERHGVEVRGGGSPGRTGWWRKCFRRKIRIALRGPQFEAVWWTSSPSGASRKGHGTCCSSRCASASIRRLRDDNAAPGAASEDAIADRRPWRRARHGRQRRQPRTGVRRRNDAALCRDGARAPGTAWRDRR